MEIWVTTFGPFAWFGVLYLLHFLIIAAAFGYLKELNNFFKNKDFTDLCFLKGTGDNIK